MSFAMLTIGLTLGLSVILTYGMRSLIAATWEKNRCDPGVVLTAAAYKPADDPRTAGEFAEANWRYCQKEYVQNAVRVAAAVPKDLAAAQAATVGRVQDMVTKSGDAFYGLWTFVHQAFSTFMDSMKGVATLFQNFIIQLHSVVERLQASIISLVFGLIAVVVTFVNSVQVVLMVAIIVVGILIVMQILLFLLLLPIAPLIVSVSALVSVVVVVMGTAIADAMVTELYTPGACFTPDTPVMMHGGGQKAMIDIGIGDALSDGGYVTAVHTFDTTDPLYDLYGISVTGDHLVHGGVHGGGGHSRLIEVREHPDAVLIETNTSTYRLSTHRLPTHRLICLTTTTRSIPVLNAFGGVTTFADWEEIPADDTESLYEWNKYVWATLNPATPYKRPAQSTIDSDAGIAPNCQVECVGLFGIGKRLRYAKDIHAGDTVIDALGEPTRVVGTVIIEGSQIADAVLLSPMTEGGEQLVSGATWVLKNGVWIPAANGSVANGSVTDIHLNRWVHVYTTSGTLRLRGGVAIRDASEVGLAHLRPLVKSVILDPLRL